MGLGPAKNKILADLLHYVQVVAKFLVILAIPCGKLRLSQAICFLKC